MNAKRDQNRITTLLVASNTDGVTPIAVCSTASTHSLCATDGTTGSDYPVSQTPRDENRIPCAMAVSSVDGITPVVLYADNLYKLLIKST